VTVAGWAKNISPGPANEAGQKLNFSVATTNDGLFQQRPAIDPANGNLTFTPAQNASGIAVITIQLRDDGGTANGGVDVGSPQTFAIAVNPAPDAPTDLALNTNTVRENAGTNVVVGTFSTSDPDPGDSHSYQLVAGEGGADNSTFTIVGSELKAIVSFDFETKNSYRIRLRTTDGSGRFLERAFTINVTNENEAPLALDDMTSAPGGSAVVVNVLANDVDPDGDRLNVMKIGVPSSGTATLFSNTVIFTPTLPFNGAVFTYTISDGSLTDSALITINTTQQMVIEPVGVVSSYFPETMWILHSPMFELYHTLDRAAVLAKKHLLLR
jgi:hypothetical protein